jgi:hypothetical protein
MVMNDHHIRLNAGRYSGMKWQIGKMMIDVTAVEHYPDDAEHNQYKLDHNTRIYP